MNSNVSLVRRIAYYSLLTMMCWSLLGLSAQAQSNAPELDQNGRWINGVTEPWWFPDSIPKEDVNAAQLLWATMGNQSSGSAWAGTYLIGGDTHGSYLRWAPQSGFVLFHVNKCEASVMGFSYGKVVASTGLIEMMPGKAATATESKKHGHGTQARKALRFLPIIWRQTRYLVREDEITQFSDYVSGLGRYNDRNFLFVEYAEFFSKSDEEISGTAESDVTRSQLAGDNDGFVEPLVPPGYEKFIKRPIDAKITARGKGYVRHNSENEWWNDLIIPVTLNVGRGRGLKKEMVLRVVGTEGFSGGEEYVKITNVNLHSAKGMIERPVRKRPCIKFDPTDDCKNPDYKPLKVGSKVTTNPVSENADSNH